MIPPFGHLKNISILPNLLRIKFYWKCSKIENIWPGIQVYYSLLTKCSKITCQVHCRHIETKLWLLQTIDPGFWETFNIHFFHLIFWIDNFKSELANFQRAINLTTHQLSTIFQSWVTFNQYYSEIMTNVRFGNSSFLA